MKIFIKLIFGLILFILLFVFIYSFIGHPQQIFGNSMSPSLPNRSIALSSKITYLFRSPRRGDIVTFKLSTRFFISRIIGLPGDKIQLLKGKVYVNDIELYEPYLLKDTKTYPYGSGFPAPENFETGVIVPNKYLFLMNDFREKANDSRGLGFIPKDSIYSVIISKL